MGLGLQLRPSLELQLKCPLCKRSSERHAADCPQLKYAKLEAQKAKLPRYECPTCNGWVEVNLHDYYECRRCHTQFSAGRPDDDGKRAKTYLYLSGSLKSKYVVILETKGDGKFPLDEQLAALGKEIARALEKAAQEEWDEFEQV